MPETLEDEVETRCKGGQWGKREVKELNFDHHSPVVSSSLMALGHRLIWHYLFNERINDRNKE